MANLGAICWSSFKDGLYSQWSSTMTSEESEKAALYKEEGRREGKEAVLESVKDRLASIESLQAELAMVRATNEMLRKSTEETAVTRAEALWATKKGEFEIEKLMAISALKEQIAEAALAKQMIVMLTKNNEECAAKISALEAARVEMLQNKTKSSHAIGKMGEATVYELLTAITKAKFPYSTVKDMTTLMHAADFHVWIMRPSGKRIKMLVDSKKYSKPVKSLEIVKLYRDIDADEESHCGLFISLESAVCGVEQFEIKTSPKCKPVIFLTLEDMNYERRSEVIVWAIQTLMTIVGEEIPAQKNRMLEDIDKFLVSINASMKQLDNVIKLQQKTLEDLRKARSGILEQMKAFSGKEEPDTIEVVSDMFSNHDEDYSTCITIVKATGLPCGKPCLEGTKKCRHHTSAKEKAHVKVGS